MNKNELIAAVAASTDQSKSDVATVIDAMLVSITETLQSGGEVKLVGFGSFHVTHRAATTGRNPRTGASIRIAASRQPKFKAGKGLRDALS